MRRGGQSWIAGQQSRHIRAADGKSITTSELVHLQRVTLGHVMANKQLVLMQLSCRAWWPEPDTKGHSNKQTVWKEPHVAQLGVWVNVYQHRCKLVIPAVTGLSMRWSRFEQVPWHSSPLNVPVNANKHNMPALSRSMAHNMASFMVSTCRYLLMF